MADRDVEVHAAFGQLDIRVNNAGILALADSQGVEDTDLEHWRGVQQVNVEGVYLGCRFAVETMKQRGGSIIESLLGRWLDRYTAAVCIWRQQRRGSTTDQVGRCTLWALRLSNSLQLCAPGCHRDTDG